MRLYRIEEQKYRAPSDKKNPPLVSLKTFRQVSQKDKKPRLKKSEKGRTEGMDKKSYSKYSLKINLQNTSYFKRISQRTSLASPVKMQVGSHSKGKTTLNLPDLENTCRNINSHYCTALKSFMYENVPVCFFLQHRKKEITHFSGALKRT